MATPQALVKYYDCLKESFNKIQDKDNETTLVNAALRPKIRDEFAKSQDVLKSYLDYIQVFSLIYEDVFSQVCSTIITPLFKEYDGEIATKIHKTISNILETKSLHIEFVSSVVKIFPTLEQDAFITYLKNTLKMFAYLNDESSIILMSKILEQLNQPDSKGEESVKKLDLIDRTTKLNESYEVIFKHLDECDQEKDCDTFASHLLRVFLQDHITFNYPDRKLNYLILYACSKSPELLDQFLDSLWEMFTDLSKSSEEQEASACYASSLIARASYIDLDKFMDYLRRACAWCHDVLDKYEKSLSPKKRRKLENQQVDSELEKSNELDRLEPEPSKRMRRESTISQISQDVINLYYIVTQSIFYLLAQRHRELYEEETISKLRELDFERILSSPLKPLHKCQPDICHKFQEVASQYKLAEPATIIASGPDPKIVKRDRVSNQTRSLWRPPFKEEGDSLPARIKPLYRNYIDHRNFTILREC